MLALFILDKISLVQSTFWLRTPTFWDPQHLPMQVTATQFFPWFFMQVFHEMYCMYIILFLMEFPGLEAQSLSSKEGHDILFILFLGFIILLGIYVQVTAFTMIRYREKIASAIKAVKAVTRQTLNITTTGRYFI